MFLCVYDSILLFKLVSLSYLSLIVVQALSTNCICLAIVCEESDFLLLLWLLFALFCFVFLGF